jgi:hypothetical protein
MKLFLMSQHEALSAKSPQEKNFLYVFPDV